jgi:hypothetical protein
LGAGSAYRRGARRPRRDDVDSAHPLWSPALVAIDLQVIYGLAVYGVKPYLTR